MIDILGHFHPLLVHLPIGILCFAFIASILPASKREMMKPFISLALIITAISATFSCITGYTLSLSGEYEENIVNKHLWLGIATTILTVLCITVPKYQRPLLWLTTVFLIVTGHFGGTLTHGEGYLFSSTTASNTLNEIEKDTITKTSNDLIKKDSPLLVKFHSPFLTDVKPILQQKCYACHSSIKKKGGLRLDTEAFILKGGKNGKIISPKDPQQSTLYTHLILPEEDELHMPPKGKKQLTASEIRIIERWIAMGASFTATEVISKPTATTIIPALPIAEEPKIVKQSVEKEMVMVDTKPLDNLGLITQQDAQGLSINFVNIKSITPAIIETIQQYAPQIKELKLAGQQNIDDLMTQLPTLSHLKKINLSKSGITNKGLQQITKFPKLEELFLYETAVSDEGVSALSNAKQLKALYIWKTQLSAKAITTLTNQKPGLQIETGSFGLKSVDSLKK